MKYYLGVDIGSISTNLVLIDEQARVIFDLYSRTSGNPIKAVQIAFSEIQKKFGNNFKITSAGVTGSGRELIGKIINADVIKNEVTAHAVGASYFYPKANTILEIGGQDSKIIILQDGIVVDFAMNSVCAAGTGSFLDSQAQRLKMPIENFGKIAVKSSNPINIAGRCTVFAESDMIHKQQMGHSIENILMGLCKAMVRNYMANIAKGKDIKPPIIFQGGVSENQGIKKAFEQEFDNEVIIPKYNKVMGAFGIALLTQNAGKTSFTGLGITAKNITVKSFECKGCANQCEIIEARINGKLASRWGDRCGKWQTK